MIHALATDQPVTVFLLSLFVKGNNECLIMKHMLAEIRLYFYPVCLKKRKIWMQGKNLYAGALFTMTECSIQDEEEEEKA